MSQKPGSTIGFERRYNRLAELADEDDFVDELTSHLAAAAAELQARGRAEPRAAAHARRPRSSLTRPRACEELLDAGATLIDGR